MAVHSASARMTVGSRSQLSPETKHYIVRIRNSDRRKESTRNSVELENTETPFLMRGMKTSC